MKFFKSKKEKFIALQEEVDKLNEEFKEYLDAYHIFNEGVIIVKKFAIYNNAINVQCIFPDTIKGYVTNVDYYFFDIKGGLKETRKRWDILKSDLERLGLEIKKIESKNEVDILLV